jgi:beta-1,4-mannosyltransferase
VDACERLGRWAHWPRRTESPYYAMFYGAMRSHGVIPVGTLELTPQWAAAPTADVIHVHWPDGLWRQRGKNAVARWRGTRRLAAWFAAVKQQGCTIAWTAHNLGAHEGGDWIDARGYRILAQAADVVICHSEWSADQVRRVYRPPGDLVIMPHGNFDGHYPPPGSREAALMTVGLDPRRPVVSCLGYLRAYKGLELACAAVARLNGVQLLIGGPRFPKYDLDPLRRALSQVPGAVLLDRRLTDQEFADLTAASDLTLLPYSAVTTSGVLMSSWSLGTAVVASDLPFFREAIPDGGAWGRLFTAGDPGSFADAITALLQTPSEARRAAARYMADKYSWQTCVRPVAHWLSEQRHRVMSPPHSRGPAAALDR